MTPADKLKAEAQAREDMNGALGPLPHVSKADPYELEDIREETLLAQIDDMDIGDFRECLEFANFEEEQKFMGVLSGFMHHRHNAVNKQPYASVLSDILATWMLRMTRTLND